MIKYKDVLEHNQDNFLKKHNWRISLRSNKDFWKQDTHD